MNLKLRQILKFKHSKSKKFQNLARQASLALPKLAKLVFDYCFNCKSVFSIVSLVVMVLELA